MKVYSPNEISKLLKINPATLRKYSIMLEERGYKIERNSQNHRYYLDKDIITLRRVITGRNNGITLDESVSRVVAMQEDKEQNNQEESLLNNTYTNATNNTVIPYESVIQPLEKKIDYQSEIIVKQNELIGELIKRLDKQDEYIKERDERLLKTIEEKLEEKKQLEAPEEKEEKKKSFFARLFKGGK